MLEQQLTNWSGFAWAGDRDVGSKCSIRYMECWLHSHRAADMCTALLWLATHACSISHCPGVKSFYHISLLELSEKLYFCLGNGTLETNTDVSVVYLLHEGSHIPQESHCNSPEKWRLCFDCWQDDHPPLPEHVSPAITDFLDQCFRKVKLFLALALEIKHLSDSHLHFSFGEVLISGHCLKWLLMVSSTLLSKQIVPAFLVFWFRCGIS